MIKYIKIYTSPALILLLLALDTIFFERFFDKFVRDVLTVGEDFSVVFYGLLFLGYALAAVIINLVFCVLILYFKEPLPAKFKTAFGVVILAVALALLWYML